jgi:hypothetical protein
MLTPNWTTCHGVTQTLIMRGSDVVPWVKQRRMLHGHQEHVERCAECRDLTRIEASLIEPDDSFQVFPA